MTNEEWAQAEKELKHLHNPVTLICDGYRLQLQLTQIGPMSLGITFFVNGWMRGEWIFNDGEERRRFFRPVQTPVHSAKSKRLYKGMSAKTLKKYDIDLNKTFTTYSFYWASFAALKRHLVKNNTSIQLAPLEAAEVKGAVSSAL